MKLKDFSKLYFVLLFLHVVTLYRPEDKDVLFLISKPLLMFSLLAYFVHRVGGLPLKGKLVYVLALLLSLLGDVLLMLEDAESYFLPGVGAFLLAQLSYAFFFFSNTRGFNWRSVVLAFVPTVAGFYLLNVVLQLPSGLQVPVNLYGVALSAMLLAAVNYGTRHGRRALFINLGAISFVISDMLLAYGKFGTGSKYINIAVMITYAIAQFLLATSVIAITEKEYYQVQSGSTSKTN